MSFAARVKRNSPVGPLLVGAVVGWNISNVSAVAPQLSGEYRVSLSVVGLLTTVVFAAHTLMQFPAGRLIDRFGAAPVCRWGLLLMIAFNLVPLAEKSVWLAFVLRSLLGIGTGLAFVGGLERIR